MENFCQVCQKFFASNFNLKRHRLTKHPEMSSNESDSEIEETSSTVESTSELSSTSSEDSDSENSCISGDIKNYKAI